MKQLVILSLSSQRLKTLHVNIIPDIPVSQLDPVYPAAHVHVYLFTLSMHRPRFLHGLLLHSITSTTNNYISDAFICRKCVTMNLFVIYQE